MPGTPTKVERDTVFECVFEIRFAEGHPSAEEFLPGVLFQALGNRFKPSAPQQIAQIPKQFRQADANMRYMATHALEADNMRLMFGSRVAALSFPKPYVGWVAVRPLILEIFRAISGTKLIGAIERLALKYTNILDVGIDEHDIGQLQVDIKLNGFKHRNAGLIIKTEIERNDSTVVVQILTGANVAIAAHGNKTEGKGVLLSVDVIREIQSLDFFEELPGLLDALHETEKEVFFGLLTPETLEKLNPSWS
jgi:uncharacterized protein (TIGR04255 family)